jgi:hypothetical protein
LGTQRMYTNKKRSLKKSRKISGKTKKQEILPLRPLLSSIAQTIRHRLRHRYAAMTEPAGRDLWSPLTYSNFKATYPQAARSLCGADGAYYKRIKNNELAFDIPPQAER